MNLQDVIALDKNDPLANKRQEFVLPPNTIYLDGNSLGALPKAVKAKMSEVMNKQWGGDLIKSWNDHNWIDLPTTVGEKIAPLVGAAEGQVICCDSISVNLFKLLSAGLSLNQGRHLILSTNDNFPTDLYMVQGLSELLGAELCQLKQVEEQEIEQHLDESVAVLLLTQVNFRTGKLLDMAKLTQLAHDKGILVIWDLAHSAGAVEVNLDRCKVDFAVGCGYKYLNGGPGAPAFLYVSKRHQAKAKQPLVGWMGHTAPFAFEPMYRASPSIHHFLSGTPNILSMSALDAALDVWQNVSMAKVRKKSQGLSELFLLLVNSQPVLSSFVLCSPADSTERASQLAFTHPHAFTICQALIERGVISDFRSPDVIRFGFTPLYTSFQDVWHCVSKLKEIVENKMYKQPRFNKVGKVT